MIHSEFGGGNFPEQNECSIQVITDLQVVKMSVYCHRFDQN
jgi:hypothetical protein